VKEGGGEKARLKGINGQRRRKKNPGNGRRGTESNLPINFRNRLGGVGVVGGVITNTPEEAKSENYLLILVGGGNPHAGAIYEAWIS